MHDAAETILLLFDSISGAKGEGSALILKSTVTRTNSPAN